MRPVDQLRSLHPYTLTGAATTLSITGDDQLLTGVTLPFAFNYFGTPYGTVGVASDGWLSFTATFSDYTPDAPTGTTGANTATPNALIAYYWADVRRPSGATGTYKTETFGTAPNRVWVMEASNLNTNGTTATSDVTCQVQLFETTNVAEIHCLKASNTASALPRSGLRTQPAPRASPFPARAPTARQAQPSRRRRASALSPMCNHARRRRRPTV